MLNAIIYKGTSIILICSGILQNIPFQKSIKSQTCTLHEVLIMM